MRIETIINHSNMQTYLGALLAEPEFTIGSRSKPDPDAWYRKRVRLEVPCGELCRDGLTALAIRGMANVEIEPLTGREGFSAQGLEGKAVIRKDLFSALMNMRDILPVHRGRIVVE